MQYTSRFSSIAVVFLVMVFAFMTTSFTVGAKAKKATAKKTTRSAPKKVAVKPAIPRVPIPAKPTVTSTGISIFEWPLPFDAERRQLSIDYLATNYGIVKSEPTIKPAMVVIHYTAIDDLVRSYNTFHGTTLQSHRKEILKAGALNVSAHYLVDQDGTIYQLLPDTVFARHIIGLNYMAIGIENIGGNKKPLTKAQVAANAKLVRHLSQKHDIKYLIGHGEYGSFRDSELWLEKDKSYFTHKSDPTGKFMDQLRESVADLALASKP